MYTDKVYGKHGNESERSCDKLRKLNPVLQQDFENQADNDDQKDAGNLIASDFWALPM